MSTTIMRQLWSIVEAAQVLTLLQLDDASLVQWLVKQTSKHILLDSREANNLGEYIQARLNLIRDIAEERQYYKV